MKRLLLFVALLAAGIVALRWAIGDENLVTTTPGSGDPAQRPSTGPAGTKFQRGGVGATVTVVGFFTYTSTRLLPEVDGVVRKQDVYALKARDSRPTETGQQQLDDVDLQLFDRGSLAATMTAKQAFVTLRADATGKVASIDEGKDIDLRNVVLVSVPGSRLSGLRLEVATARIQIEGDEIQLTTPREEPVLVRLDGERRLTLRGRGAQALLPRNREGALRRADVEILQDPVLETDGMQVTAKGRLHFVEDLDTGAATVTIDDQVELVTTRGDLARFGSGAVRSADPASSTVRIRGDQFVGWLLRSREATAAGGERQQFDWRQLVLTGSPAVVEMPGSRLTTPKVTAIPGLFGDPVLITAHGGESRVEQTELRPGAKQKDLLVGTSSRRLHFAMLRDQFGAMHRSFGFPRWSMRPMEQLQVVLVEGAGRAMSGPSTYEASDGVRIYRREGGDGKAPADGGAERPPVQTGVVRGLGKVRVEQRATSARQQDLVATGNDGFLLQKTVERELLQLGPPAPADLDAPGPWRTHEFDVQHGDATMHGHGACELERIGETTRVSFVTPDADMVAVMPGEGLRLQRVRRLQGRFVDKLPSELDVAGWPTEITFVRGADSVVAKAPRLLQVGARSLRLLPPDDAAPALWSGLPAADRLPMLRRTIAGRKDSGPQQVEMRGPSIDVHHAGGHDVVVDAIAVGDELPHIYARLAQPGRNEVTTIACAAGRLRLLPFVLSRDVQRWLTASQGGAFAIATFHGLARPWLLVDDVRDFQLDDARQGHVEGHGRRLLVSQGGRAALFVGDPETMAPAEVTRTHEGRKVSLFGARVRVFDDQDVRLQAMGAFDDRSTFLPPTMTLHETDRTGLLSHMQATCRGSIEVHPEAVVFLGPVVAQGLRPDGTLDPDGIRIDARDLRMARHPDIGKLVRVIGKGVVVDLNGVHATCADVDLDVLRNVLLATDPDEAKVVLPDGIELRSPRIEVNWETIAFTMSGGHIGRSSVTPRPK